MSVSKLKDRLRHYKSLENLYTLQGDNSLDKKHPRKTGHDTSKLGKPSRKALESRLATEVNDKLTCTKEELRKYAKILRNDSRPKKLERTDSKGKLLQGSKQLPAQNNSTKKPELNKRLSPVVSRFGQKKELTEIGGLIKSIKPQKKNLKKGKNVHQHSKFHPKIEHAESILIEKSEKMERMDKPNKISKSKEGRSIDAKSKHKSKKKMQKINSEVSVESTPSFTMTEEIELMDLVGEGTFGKVFMGKLKKTGQIIAIKRVLQDSRYKNRQIEIIRMLRNDFVMQVLGSYITYQAGLQYLNIMMKYYEENLYNRIKSSTRINQLDMKIIIYQIFKGLSYLHSMNICHRDIKPQNILLKGNSAVICDFGSAKILNSVQSNISYICARCYRAPELIFGSTKYTTVIDMWSAGCVILEMLNDDPLFIGDTSISHLHEIFKILGTPTPQEAINMNPDYDIKEFKYPRIKKREWNSIFTNTDKLLISMIDQIMVYSPKDRLKAVEALSHPYFDELRDQTTYTHVQAQYNLKDFFNFSEQELVGNKHLRSRLIPPWYVSH